MNPIILIQSSPITISGTSYITSGQTVHFTVVSGISNGVIASWYLNDVLVALGSGYTLTNPATNDVVYAKVINCCCGCSGETGGGSSWIEDINFDFYGQVNAGWLQMFYIDTYASFDYTILSAVLMCDPEGSTVNDIEIWIDGTPIVWDGSVTTLNITDIITSTDAVTANNVTADSVVTLNTFAYDTGTPTTIRGKLKIRRN